MGTAKAFLGLSEKKFWRTSPRRLLVMIEEWKRIQRSLQGIPEPGEESTGAGMTAEEAMWASWDSF